MAAVFRAIRPLPHSCFVALQHKEDQRENQTDALRLFARIAYDAAQKKHLLMKEQQIPVAWPLPPICDSRMSTG
ncbi:hypothetical protein HNQ50_003807 [Silvimonas terrae]|uniref:Uncharacterized protein n=1 Tax=Silvimonas terrae TaxID=300266 RepID=A0A840RLJ2_9NEIS|nr:hypothetical protein [Silvimonas terrae]MBB5193053.1 hypothetical protein [Silvimonas terrae]